MPTNGFLNSELVECPILVSGERAPGSIEQLSSLFPAEVDKFSSMASSAVTHPIVRRFPS